MGYSEQPTFTLTAKDVPAHQSGDKIYFYLQASPIVGEGADDVAKAEFVNTAQVTNSDWSKVASVTFP